MGSTIKQEDCSVLSLQIPGSRGREMKPRRRLRDREWRKHGHIKVRRRAGSIRLAIEIPREIDAPRCEPQIICHRAVYTLVQHSNSTGWVVHNDAAQRHQLRGMLRDHPMEALEQLRGSSAEAQ